MNAAIILITFMLLLGINKVYPQEKPLAKSDLKKDIAANHNRSYITALEGLGNMEPLFFEANLAPYYLIRLKEEYHAAIELSPQVAFRMYREESFPIRTPSYMPRVTFYRNLHKLTTGSRSVTSFLSVVHHSNGQNGDFYNENGSINTYDGNFATNYLELGALFIQKDLKTSNRQRVYKSYLEYHFSSDRNLQGLLGTFRLNFEFQLIHHLNSSGKAKNKENEKHRIRQTFEAGWVFAGLDNVDAINIKERLLFNFTVSYHPRIAEDMSFFIQYYYGQDYYNIFFDRDISVLRIGLMSDQLKLW